MKCKAGTRPDQIRPDQIGPGGGKGELNKEGGFTCLPRVYDILGLFENTRDTLRNIRKHSEIFGNIQKHLAKKWDGENLKIYQVPGI